jgi:hypothetical protein
MVRVSIGIVVFLLAAIAAVVFTGVMEVREVRTSDLPDELAQRINDIARSWLDERDLLIRHGSIVLLARPALLTQRIATEVPELMNISVDLDAPHALIISAEIRIPEGIWCRGDVCRFWDRTGTFWGSVVPSVGPLLMLIRDDRTDDEDTHELFAGILMTLDGLEPLGLSAKYVVIPDAEPGGIRIPTNRGWDLLIDTANDIEDQLRTLDVLLADKASDSSFLPLYVDLRTPGRVYYR